MFYTDVLKKHSLTEDQVSQRLKAKIKQYKKIQQAVEEARTKHLPNAKTEAKKKEIEDEITIGDENLVRLNEDISKHIELFVSQKDANARRAEALKKNREMIGKNKKTEGDDQSEPPAATPAKVVEMKTDPKQEPAPPAPPPASTEPKKKSNALGWIAGLAVAGVAIFFGIKQYNKTE